MNRSFALTVGLLLAFGSTAYAQSFRLAPASAAPVVVGGEINAGGTVLKGSGFAAEHLSIGIYRVRFDRSVFANTCPVMTATAVAYQTDPPSAQVYQTGRSSCSKTYEVIFINPATGQPSDQTFDFVAVGAVEAS